MALTKQKTVNLSGESKIDNETVARFSAQVSSNDALSQELQQLPTLIFIAKIPKL